MAHHLPRPIVFELCIKQEVHTKSFVLIALHIKKFVHKALHQEKRKIVTHKQRTYFFGHKEHDYTLVILIIQALILINIKKEMKRNIKH